MLLELILNPIAGNGRAKKVLDLVARELSRQGIEHHVSRTTAPGHATLLTQQAIDRGCDRVAVLGGDGLLSEVCQALMDTRVALLFVPCGTGNDFIRTLHLPKDPVQALRLQLSTPVRAIDCGRVNEHAFLNVAGLGFDVETLKQTERFKRNRAVRGMGPYLLGLFAGFKNFRPFCAEIQLDGVTEHRSYTIVSMANGQYIGGGMRVAPRADSADGLFDVMLVDAVPKWKFLLCVPLFLPGLHTRLKVVRRVQAREVRIKSGQGFWVEADGELKWVEKAHFSLHAGSICICCPKQE